MSGEQNVNCHDVMHHICDSLGEDLQSERCRQIKQHLDTCNDCQNYFESVETTIDFYKNLKEDLPNGAHDRLLDFLKLRD